MCGLIINYEASGELNELQFSTALGALSHRGPDAQGLVKTENIIFGHRRLSILDLTKNSDQPFKYTNYWMVYNGEIFNYVELKQELESLGHHFLTQSDTEVVLHAFEEWGQQCFQRFNGMCALCIYNEVTHEITVSRDRFGMKPLFVYQSDGSLVICSEVEPITILKDNLTRNYSEIVAFLREGTHETHGDTFFQEIMEVQPASVIVFKQGKLIENHLFWHYPTRNKRTNANISRLINF